MQQSGMRMAVCITKQEGGNICFFLHKQVKL